MRILWISLTSLLVVAAVGAPLLFWGSEGDDEAEAAGPRFVEEEQHYYVLLSVVEVAPQDEDNEEWDSSDNPPDVYYEVRWQGQEVFESTTKDDTLVARWSNVSVDLLGSVSLDDSVQAARITARKGKLEFKVYDHDVASHDLIGAWTVDVLTLQIGDQRWERPAPGLVSVTCRVLPLDGVGFEALTK